MGNWSSITAAAKRAGATLIRNPEVGEERFRELFEQYPDDGMLFLERGRARAQAGDIAGARTDLEQAVDRLRMASWKRIAREALARLSGSTSRDSLAQHPTSTIPSPTPEELAVAHQVFVANEPRALDFDVAARLLAQALERPDELTPTTPTAMLLQSWNFAYYQQGRRFDAEHFQRLDIALRRLRRSLLDFRGRAILQSLDDDRSQVVQTFSELSDVVGRVGAVKALHLWAPEFFPLWDNPIAGAYGFDLADPPAQYWEYMRIVCGQIRALVPPPGVPPLKALDEYNYCRFTKGWITA